MSWFGRFRRRAALDRDLDRELRIISSAARRR